jgi:hypothetical protein
MGACCSQNFETIQCLPTLRAARPSSRTASTASLAAATAWKFLTRNIITEQTKSLIRFEGDEELARRFLKVQAIMMAD